MLASRSTEKAQCQEKDKSTLETGKCLSPFHSEADLPWMGAPRTDLPPNETESQASQPPSIHIKASSYCIYSSPTSTASSSFLTQISHSTLTHALPGSEQQCWDVLKPKSSEVQPLQMTLFHQQTIIGSSYPLKEFCKTPLKSTPD